MDQNICSWTDKDGVVWTARIVDQVNDHVEISIALRNPIRGQSGVVYPNSHTSVLLPTEFIATISQHLAAGAKPETKAEVKNKFTQWLEDKVKRQSDLRYGTRESAALTLGYSLGSLSSLTRDFETLREVVQEFVVDGLLGFDVFGRFLVYKPEVFYKGWT